MPGLDDELERYMRLAGGDPPAPLDAETDLELGAALEALDSGAGDTTADPWAESGDAPARRHRGAGKEYERYSNEEGEFLGVPQNYEDSPSTDLDEYMAFLRAPRASQHANDAEREFLSSEPKFGTADWARRTQMSASEQQADTDRRRMQHQTGLEQARARDKGRMLVADANPAMGVLLVRAGIPSEQVKTMTMEQAEGLQKWLMSGGQYLANKNRGQDIDLYSTLVKELADTRRGDVDTTADLQTEQLREQGRMDRAAMRQKGGSGAGGAPGIANPDDNMVAAHLLRQFNPPGGAQVLTREQALQFARGETPQGLEHISDSVWAEVTQYKGTDKLGRRSIASSGTSREGQNVDQPVRSAAGKQLDPKVRLQMRREVSDMERALGGASKAWRVLSANPRALQTVISLGSQGFKGDVTDATLSPAEQAAASALLRVISAYAFGQGGKQLTGTERDILQSGAGMSLGSMQPFKSPKVLSEFLRSMKRGLSEHKSNVQREYGAGFWEGQ